MKEIHCNYSNVPCQGQDCKFWQGKYEEKTHRPKGYGELGVWHEEFISIWHGEHCEKSSDLGTIRQEIYDRALEASDNIHKSNKYKIITTMVKKSGEAFDKIADEWRNMKCPFYEKTE
jgi:hypothetical protein